MMMAFEAVASVTSDSVMPPTPRHQDLRRHFVGRELVERGDDRFDRALHVALDDQRELGDARGLELIHHLLEAGGAAAGRLLADDALAIFGDFAGTRFGLDHREAVAGDRARR